MADIITEIRFTFLNSRFAKRVEQNYYDNDLKHMNNAGSFILDARNQKNEIYVKGSTWFRNHTAKCIKIVRKKYPAQIIDYSKAKSLYVEMQNDGTILDASSLSPDTYITCLRNEYTVKGEKYESYFINYTSCGEIGKAEKFENTGMDIGQYRLSTNSEIVDAIQEEINLKNAEIHSETVRYNERVNKLNKAIKKLNTELSKLK